MVVVVGVVNTVLKHREVRLIIAGYHMPESALPRMRRALVMVGIRWALGRVFARRRAPYLDNGTNATTLYWLYQL